MYTVFAWLPVTDAYTQTTIVHTVSGAEGKALETYRHESYRQRFDNLDHHTTEREKYTYDEAGRLLRSDRYIHKNYRYMELYTTADTASSFSEYRYSGDQIAELEHKDLYNPEAMRRSTYSYRDSLLVKTRIESSLQVFPGLHYYTYDSLRRLSEETIMSVTDTNRIQAKRVYEYRPDIIVCTGYDDSLQKWSESLSDHQGHILELRYFTPGTTAASDTRRYIYNKKGELLRETLFRHGWKKEVTLEKHRYRNGRRYSTTTYFHVTDSGKKLPRKATTLYRYTTLK
ncbi:MAG: hypothetical protein IBJ09_15880 [Bacteroidia bacterium]|nr:hypothetical protein [Bacteroidia bacterium]